MLRNSIKPRIIGGGVARCVRRYSTQDWEGIHGYTGDTKLPFTAWQPSFSSPTTQASKPASSSTTSKPNPQVQIKVNEAKTVGVKTKKTSIQQQDDLLREKLEAISGGGGEAGVQSEDGKNVGLKRGVRENMFRII